MKADTFVDFPVALVGCCIDYSYTKSRDAKKESYVNVMSTLREGSKVVNRPPCVIYTTSTSARD